MRREAIVYSLVVMLFFVLTLSTSTFIGAAESHGSFGTTTAQSNTDSVDWWPMFHHDVDHTGYSTSAPTTNHTAWSYATGSYVLSSPAVVGGLVYVGSEDGNLYCLNGSTGALLWSYTTGGAVYSSPAVDNGMVYVGSDDDNVYALNATTGAAVWNFTTAGHVESSPAVANGAVYVGSDDNNSYCLNASTGALLWSYTTGGAVYSSPAVDNGMVYVGSDDDNVYALNATTGALVWDYATGAWVQSSPAVANGAVYVGSDDNNVYCLNASTGTLAWNYTAGLALSSPAVAGGDVYLGLEDGVCCLNGASGTPAWSYMTGEVDCSAAVVGGMVYVGSDDGNLYCLNASTGALVWSYMTGGAVYSSPAVAEGMLYVGSQDDNLYCFGSSQTYVYSVVICAHDYSANADVGVPVTMDGLPASHETPYTLVGLTGTHTFTVTTSDANNDVFLDWEDGERTTTITVSSGGVYTAYYVASGETILPVPFSYQEKDYYCGPACLQMVFSYYGRSISQSEIACAARTVGFPSYYGTMDDELRRAAQFSNSSTSLGNQLPYNITGYTSEPLGCSTFETYGMNLTVLESFLEQGKPIILCMWFTSSHLGGHYRVAIGYNQTDIFMQDPWNEPLWGETPAGWGWNYGGPVTAFNISQFMDLWSGDDYYGLYVSPWNVTFSAPTGVSPGTPFQVQSTVTYPQPLPNALSTYPASSCEASITLPSGLILAPGDNQTKTLGTGFMQAGNSQSVTWTLIANSSLTGTVSITAQGMISGSVIAFGNYQAYNYSDQIGAAVNFTINVTTSPYPDVAVTEVSCCKTIVGQGYSQNVTVTVANFGNCPETFNVTLYANSAPIENITVTNLLSITSAVITFTWNTTGFAYGNYTVSAYAWPVQNETNTANNNCTGGNVLVTIPGDVDGNFQVDKGDIAIILTAFGSTPGKPNWNPNCDIDDNDRVNMGDVVIALRNFGKHYP